MNIGIDIGSTASKVVVYDKDKDEILYKILRVAKLTLHL